MAVISLNLDKLKFANVTNFSRNYGAKKTTNGGSLTTEEFNIANALPFDTQRPYVVTESSTFTSIEYDAKLLVNAASVTVTLGTATTGITITIATLYDTTVSYGDVTQTLKAGETCKLMYFNDVWKDQLNSSLAELKENVILKEKSSGNFSNIDISDYDNFIILLDNTVDSMVCQYRFNKLDFTFKNPMRLKAYTAGGGALYVDLTLTGNQLSGNFEQSFPSILYGKKIS